MRVRLNRYVQLISLIPKRSLVFRRRLYGDGTSVRLCQVDKSRLLHLTYFNTRPLPYILPISSFSQSTEDTHRYITYYAYNNK